MYKRDKAYIRDINNRIVRFLGVSAFAAALVLALDFSGLSGQADGFARIGVFFGITLLMVAAARRIRTSDVICVALLLVVGSESARPSPDPLPLLCDLLGVALAAAPVWLVRSRNVPRRRASDGYDDLESPREVRLQAWVVGPAA